MKTFVQFLLMVLFVACSANVMAPMSDDFDAAVVGTHSISAATEGKTTIRVLPWKPHGSEKASQGSLLLAVPPMLEIVDPPTQVPVPEIAPIDVPAEPSSPAFALIFHTILGLHPEWRFDACDKPFAQASSKVVCERVRNKGLVWASKIALYIYTEATRQNICQPDNPLCYLWFVGQGNRESGLSEGDICKVTLAASWVEEIPANAQLNERVRMCWRRGTNAGRNCQKVYLRARNERQYVVDRCAFGEVGIFQVRSHEARSGQIIPATGEPLPPTWVERRVLLLDPWKNISLAFAAFSVVRDYCCGVGDTADELCRARPDGWVGCFNSGKCKGTQFVRYVDKIGRALVKSMKYVCTIFPNLTFGEFGGCNADDMSYFFTPPAGPRHRRHRS